MSLSFLILLAMKSTAVLAVAFVVVAVFRGRPAADKAAILRCALFALLFLPVFDAVLPALPVEVSALQPISAGIGSEVLSVSGQTFNWVACFAVIYAAGVVIGFVRLTRDIAVLNQWIAQAETVASPAWRRACAEAELPSVRLLVSPRVDAPISFGWLRPVVLIDRFSASRDDAARPILAHELAHIARGDWLLTMASTVVAILFWFNPLAWAAKRAADHFAEEAVDQLVLGQVSATNYAQVLLECAKTKPVMSVAALGVAARGASLKRRMRLILAGVSNAKPGMQSSVIATVSMLSVAVLAAVQVATPPVVNAAAAQVVRAVAPAASMATETAPPVAAASTQAAAATLLIGAETVPAIADAASEAPTFTEAALSPVSRASAPLEAPTEINALQPAASERQRERWMANAEQNAQRNNRRAENFEREQRALANRLWALEHSQPPQSAN